MGNTDQGGAPMTAARRRRTRGFSAAPFRGRSSAACHLRRRELESPDVMRRANALSARQGWKPTVALAFIFEGAAAPNSEDWKSCYKKFTDDVNHVFESSFDIQSSPSYSPSAVGAQVGSMCQLRFPSDLKSFFKVSSSAFMAVGRS